MSETNLRHMHTFFSLANVHDVSGVAGMVHAGYIGESDVLPEPIVGQDAYRSLLAGFWAAFPDTTYHIQQMLAADDCVVTRLRLTGTHQGTFMGKEGTGRTFDVRICHVDHLEDGKIARAWYYWDTATLMRQLGLPTAPASV